MKIDPEFALFIRQRLRENGRVKHIDAWFARQPTSVQVAMRYYASTGDTPPIGLLCELYKEAKTGLFGIDGLSTVGRRSAD